jgi:hypothetical protein
LFLSLGARQQLVGTDQRIRTSVTIGSIDGGNKRSLAMLTGQFTTQVFNAHLELTTTCRAALQIIRGLRHDGISFHREPPIDKVLEKVILDNPGPAGKSAAATVQNSGF